MSEDKPECACAAGLRKKMTALGLSSLATAGRRAVLVSRGCGGSILPLNLSGGPVNLCVCHIRELGQEGTEQRAAFEARYGLNLSAPDPKPGEGILPHVSKARAPKE